MNTKGVIAIGVVCLLLGVLGGYLYWGPRADRLAGELSELRAGAERATERQRQVEEQLKQAEVRVRQLAEDLELERQRRSKLESLVSRGRK